MRSLRQELWLKISKLEKLKILIQKTNLRASIPLLLDLDRGFVRGVNEPRMEMEVGDLEAVVVLGLSAFNKMIIIVLDGMNCHPNEN